MVKLLWININFYLRKEKLMIRDLKEEDITKVMTIWTKGNFQAHSFIDRDYWISNYNNVKNEYLPQSKTYIYEEQGEIQGFVSVLKDGYIGALFIKKDYQRQGIGRKLINHCKDLHDTLTIKAYYKNMNAILFYNAMGFKNIKMQIDKETNEVETIMQWRKE